MKKSFCKLVASPPSAGESVIRNQEKDLFSETPSIFHFSHRLTARLEIHYESRINIFPKGILGNSQHC